MRCLFKQGAAHTHTHTHANARAHLHIVSDVRNIVSAHQISLKWFCSSTTSHDFIYLYIKAFPEQAAFIFKAFFFLQFFLIESPFTSNEGCVRLIMSKVSRKVWFAVALSFLILALGCSNRISWPYNRTVVHIPLRSFYKTVRFSKEAQRLLTALFL